MAGLLYPMARKLIRQRSKEYTLRLKQKIPTVATVVLTNNHIERFNSCRLLIQAVSSLIDANLSSQTQSCKNNNFEV